MYVCMYDDKKEEEEEEEARWWLWRAEAWEEQNPRYRSLWFEFLHQWAPKYTRQIIAGKKKGHYSESKGKRRLFKRIEELELGFENLQDMVVLFMAELNFPKYPCVEIDSRWHGPQGRPNVVLGKTTSSPYHSGPTTNQSQLARNWQGATMVKISSAKQY